MGPVNSKWEEEVRLCAGTPKEAQVARQYKEEQELTRTAINTQVERDEETSQLKMKKEHMEQVLKMVAVAAPQFATEVEGEASKLADSQADDHLSERMEALRKMQADLGSRKHDEIEAALADLDVELNNEMW